MTIDAKDALELVLDTARKFNAEGDAQIDLSAQGDSILFGQGATIDSLGLVRFIMAVEQEIEERCGKSVTIASEQALSRKKSPFRTLKSLAEYVTQLVAET